MSTYEEIHPKAAFYDKVYKMYTYSNYMCTHLKVYTGVLYT